jgi:hypothetical protein
MSAGLIFNLVLADLTFLMIQKKICFNCAKDNHVQSVKLTSSNSKSLVNQKGGGGIFEAEFKW